MQGKEIENNGGVFELFFQRMVRKRLRKQHKRDLNEMRERVVVPAKEIANAKTLRQV